ncbi:MAG: metal ABC transporter ATP-binding protein [Candidatus Cloacimonetes bacterium]|nr:metal ABC transporter ATP-binding protein [Candidatus Cloacimonadota bacterium]
MSANKTANTSSTPMVKFEDITVVLGGNTILDNVTASVPKGSSTAIVGPNGAGKTTLLMALLGQIPYKGKISIASAESGDQPRIGYVPQRLNFDRAMPLTVMEFMVMGVQRMPLWFGVRNKNYSKAMSLLSMVKLDGLEKRKIGVLSGGEIQKLLLALALGQNPDLLVLDEPAAGVDYQGESVFCELLEGLRQKHGFTQLMVSHDLATVTYHATHVICMNKKVAAEGKPEDVLTNETLKAVFGIHMGLVDSNALPKCRSNCTKANCCGDNENA